MAIRRDSSSRILKSQDIYFREAEMLSGSALIYKQERSASDLCRWYHTKNPNLLKKRGSEHNSRAGGRGGGKDCLNM